MHVPIPVDDVRAALPAWGIEPRHAKFAELPRGATAEVWKVECEQGRFVAKYAYDDRDHFENGLRAAEVALQAGLHSAAPLRTNDGDMTVMLEWPAGHWHPLALLHWVDGTVFQGEEPEDIAEFARIHGTLQSALAREIPVNPAADPFSYLDYLGSGITDGDTGALPALVETIASEARWFQESTPMTVANAVWDGPETLIDKQGRIGLIDFGYCRPMPVLHAMANRSLRFGLEENEKTRQFVDLYLKHFPLTETELAGVPLFRKVSLAIYCKYQAGRLADGGLGEAKRARLRAYLDAHLPLLA